MVSQRQGGFTLPELMITVAVLAVLGAIAAPSFTALIASQRLKSATSDVFTSLTRGRSEAIKRNREVTLAPLTAGTSWHGGWRISNPNPTYASVPLEQRGALANATISGPTSVTFRADGRIRGATAFDIAVSGIAQHRCVRMDLSGRPYQTLQGC
jgi:type IV fimbrial biogenesis protein FimT